MFKNTIYSIVALFLCSVTSCDSDDDLPTGPSISVNSFCYGIDSASSFVTAGAYNRPVEETTTGIFKTAVQITDENLSIAQNGDITGLGVLLSVDLYGNRDQAFQTGTYVIGDTQEVGDVVVRYSIDYDSSIILNPSLALTGGLVSVNPYRTGYAIEIDGEDANGDRFHGIYLGNVSELD